MRNYSKVEERQIIVQNALIDAINKDLKYYYLNSDKENMDKETILKIIRIINTNFRI